MTAIPSYSVGTVSVKKGDTVVVGAGGPLWTSTANARAGDDIIIAGHIWPLSDVIDATHLSIDPWPFDDVPAGRPYKILQRSPLRFAGGQAMADVTQLVGALNTEGLFRIVPTGAAAPDPSLGEENQYALQPSTFRLWLKIGGQWVFQGIFKGFRVRGPYSSTAAYLTNDIVSQDGASYVALVDNTGQPVTTAAAWALFAAKGDQGEQGPQGNPGANGADGTDGAGYGGTSGTSLAIGTGSKTFTAQAGLAYQIGNYVRASSAADGTNFMEGTIIAYSGTSMTINIMQVGGSGTHADWHFAIAGIPGSTGLSINGASGALTLAGAGGVSVGTAGSTITASIDPSYLQTFLAKLALSNDATADIANEIAVQDGVCTDSGNSVLIKLSSVISRKKINVVWAAGSNAGMLDTGAIADGSYFIFLIAQAGGANPDILASLSPTAPTMPSGYAFKRRIGAIVRKAGANLQFVQDGNKVSWVNRTIELNSAINYGIARVSQAITIPVGIRVEAFGSMHLNVNANTGIVVTDLATTDVSPVSASGMDLFALSGNANAGQWQAMSNMSGQVGVRVGSTGASIFVTMTTKGYYDTRGQ
jgi:hypothetical protein